MALVFAAVEVLEVALALLLVFERGPGLVCSQGFVGDAGDARNATLGWVLLDFFWLVVFDDAGHLLPVLKIFFLGFRCRH